MTYCHDDMTRDERKRKTQNVWAKRAGRGARGAFINRFRNRLGSSGIGGNTIRLYLQQFFVT